MGTHLTHEMHLNSLEGFKGVDSLTRVKEILPIYLSNPDPLTDRQIAKRLGYPDLNAVRPRITELIDLKIVKEFGKVKDEMTGRTVRITQLNKEVDNITPVCFEKDRQGQFILKG